MTWIAVTERLPARNETVFACLDEKNDIHTDLNYEPHNGKWEREHEMGWWVPHRLKITHWMLPPDFPQ